MNKRGISLLALIATIIISIIILSTIIIAYDSILDNTQKREFAREMYTLQTLMTDYDFMNGGYPIKEGIVLDLNNIPVASQDQFINEPGYATNSIILNKIDLFKAGVDKITRGTTSLGVNDFYAFSTSTKRIYYIMGQEIGNTTYYTLTDELYNLIDIKNVE